MITWHSFISPRGYEPPFDGYRSRFGFIWWFWIPRLHTQHSDRWNPRVLRLVWLCFGAGIEIWGTESKDVWPSVLASNHKPKESKL